ncbi:hypothetical protein RR48_02231, partial [Papilio machaon]
IVEDRRRHRILAEQDPGQKPRYDELRRQAQRVIRQAKRKHLEDRIKEMETLIRANESHKFYQEIRAVKKDINLPHRFFG